MDYEEQLKKENEQRAELFVNLKGRLAELCEQLESLQRWAYEDLVYRFYHQSFKVYGLQSATEDIIEELMKLSPEGVGMNPYFKEIFEEGTGKSWELSHNREWTKHTRPIIEAFMHAKYFLEMACKFGEELEEDPQILPSGYAAFLYLYNLR